MSRLFEIRYQGFMRDSLDSGWRFFQERKFVIAKTMDDAIALISEVFATDEYWFGVHVVRAEPVDCYSAIE